MEGKKITIDAHTMGIFPYSKSLLKNIGSQNIDIDPDQIELKDILYKKLDFQKYIDHLSLLYKQSHEK